MSDPTAPIPAECPTPKEVAAPWEVTIKFTIPAKDISDALCAMLNDDSSWAAFRRPKGTTPQREFAEDSLALDRNPLIVYDTEEHERYILDAAALQRGLELYTKANGWPEDMGNFDAGCADELLQYSLFGEIIYG